MPDEMNKWTRTKDRPRDGGKPFVAKYSATASQQTAPPTGSDPYQDEIRRDRIIFLWSVGVLGFLVAGGLLIYLTKK